MSVLFLTVASVGNLSETRLLIESLRTFGGNLSEAPFWVFSTDPVKVSELEKLHSQVLPLAVPEVVSSYPFGQKVAACALAEELIPSETRSLVWLDSSCLVVQQPDLFMLENRYRAAFRPVHIRNVGLSPSMPLDSFWEGVYKTCGAEDISTTVTSFVDNQVLRSYYNSHGFSVDPTLGILRSWFEHFQVLINDKVFQLTSCSEEIHQIFLFQAILSTVVAVTLEPENIRLLPIIYNYPYHLQKRIPLDRRLTALNDAACFVYEENSIHPASIEGIEMREPLCTWLESRISK